MASLSCSKIFASPVSIPATKCPLTVRGTCPKILSYSTQSFVCRFRFFQLSWDETSGVSGRRDRTSLQFYSFTFFLLIPFTNVATCLSTAFKFGPVTPITICRCCNLSNYCDWQQTLLAMQFWDCLPRWESCALLLSKKVNNNKTRYSHLAKTSHNCMVNSV